MAKSESVIARFWRYSPNGLAPDVCWPWESSIDARGYGQLSDKPNKTVLKAHRLAYEMHIGPIPDGLSVCHRCDNPRCVNPAHLFAATHAENMADKDRKGRNVAPPTFRGSEAPWSILTESDVMAIRTSSRPSSAIAAELGVSKSTVKAARRGQTWGHL